MEQVENKVPNFIKNRIDLRHQTLSLFNSAVETLKSNENDVITIGADTGVLIMTNFGVVSGNIKELGTSEESTEETKPGQLVFKMLLEALLKTRNQYLSEDEESIGQENLRVINDSSFVVLENVVVTPFANPNVKTKFESLMLFTDQIVGITFGSVKID